MNFQLNEEQTLLRDSVVRWVAERGQPAAGQAAGGDSAVAPGAPSARWREMAGFGWLAMTLPEAHGGLGQGLAEACVVAEALGAGPVSEPYAAAIVQAAGLVANCGSDAQRARWLPSIGAGELLLVPAHIERGGGVATTAERVAGGWRLRGAKSVVPSGSRAGAWLVSAREQGGRRRAALLRRAARRRGCHRAPLRHRRRRRCLRARAERRDRRRRCAARRRRHGRVRTRR